MNSSSDWSLIWYESTASSIDGGATSDCMGWTRHPWYEDKLRAADTGMCGNIYTAVVSLPQDVKTDDTLAADAGGDDNEEEEE